MTAEVVIVTGLPATGKTTIARRLSASLGWPMFSKDDFKELLFDRIGHSDREWSKKLGAASYGILGHIAEQELAAGRSFIIETNFPAESAELFVELADRHHVRYVQVLCHADGDVVMQRFTSRSDRHPGHVDDVVAETQRDLLLSGKQAALDVGGELVEVDTTNIDDASVDSVVHQIIDILRR